MEHVESCDQDCMDAIFTVDNFYRDNLLDQWNTIDFTPHSGEK